MPVVLLSVNKVDRPILVLDPAARDDHGNGSRYARRVGFGRPTIRADQPAGAPGSGIGSTSSQLGPGARSTFSGTLRAPRHRRPGARIGAASAPGDSPPRRVD